MTLTLTFGLLTEPPAVALARDIPVLALPLLTAVSYPMPVTAVAEAVVKSKLIP